MIAASTPIFCVTWSWDSALLLVKLLQHNQFIVWSPQQGQQLHVVPGVSQYGMWWCIGCGRAGRVAILRPSGAFQCGVRQDKLVLAQLSALGSLSWLAAADVHSASRYILRAPAAVSPDGLYLSLATWQDGGQQNGVDIRGMKGGLLLCVRLSFAAHKLDWAADSSRLLVCDRTCASVVLLDFG